MLKNIEIALNVLTIVLNAVVIVLVLKHWKSDETK